MEICVFVLSLRPQTNKKYKVKIMGLAAVVAAYAV